MIDSYEMAHLAERNPWRIPIWLTDQIKAAATVGEYSTNILNPISQELVEGLKARGFKIESINIDTTTISWEIKK